jgi:hypothetical protein
VKKFSTLFLLFFATYTSQLSAQIIASTASGNWNATTTWVGGVVPSATDSVTISGTDTVAVTANASCGALTIGGGAAVAILNINSGVTLTVAKAAAINRATTDSTVNVLNVGAGTLTAASVDLRGNATNPTRITRLSISTGTVNAVGSTTPGIDGNINATGAPSEVVFTGAGRINIKKNFMSGANGGTLTAGAGTIAADGTLTMIFGAYTYNNITLAGTGGAQFIGNTVINGTFNNTANNLNVKFRGNLTSTGTFNAGTGTYGFESTTPTANLVTTQTLTGNFTLAKIEIDTNLTLTIPAASTLSNSGLFSNYGTLVSTGTFTKTGGSYKGNGTFSGKTYVNTASIVAPGDTLGCLTFSNGYDNGTGTLDIDISGATVCTLYDQLKVTGTAKASGILRVNFGNYLPSVNQTFPIISGATTYTGTFDSIAVLPRRVKAAYNNGVLTVTGVTTSTQSVAENSSFKIKTSLVNDFLTLISTETVVTNISISNIAGQVLMTAKTQGEQTLNVAHLPKGLYIVHTPDGQVGRFVKF